MIPGTGRHRRFRITIRLSSAERRWLDQEAERCGITLSAFARNALLCVKPLRSARRPSAQTSLLVRILDRLGTVVSALRGISLQFTATLGEDLPSVQRELLRTLAELRALRPPLLQALGKRRHTT
jgi:hypothetical protein